MDQIGPRSDLLQVFHQVRSAENSWRSAPRSLADWQPFWTGSLHNCRRATPVYQGLRDLPGMAKKRIKKKQPGSRRWLAVSTLAAYTFAGSGKLALAQKQNASSSSSQSTQ